MRLSYQCIARLLGRYSRNANRPRIPLLLMLKGERIPFPQLTLTRGADSPTISQSGPHCHETHTGRLASYLIAFW